MAPSMETASEEEAVATDATVSLPELPRLSQREYIPTPYMPTQWEFVGEPPTGRAFVSLELEVLQDQSARFDPMFEDFSGGSALLSGTLWQAPGSDPRQEVVEEIQEPQFDMAQFEAELAARYEAGRQEGLAEGKAEAEAKIGERYEELCNNMQSLTSAIHEEVREKVTTLEQHALKISLDVAKKIVQTTVDVKPEYILEILRRAMGSLGAAKPLRVRVSLDDYDFLDVIGLPPDLSPGELGITYVSDSSIKSGCVVESDFGEVNLELDKMWEEVVRALVPVSS